MITTKRLNIVPLRYEEFIDYVNLRCGSVKTDEDALWVIENHIFKMTGRNDLFCTFWLAMDQAKEVIAEAAFKGEPNECGEVEIGCYVMEEYRGLRYGSELIGGMVEWAKMQPNVEFIVAGVSHENVNSAKMLKNNNFVYWGEKNNLQIFYKKSNN